MEANTQRKSGEDKRDQTPADAGTVTENDTKLPPGSVATLDSDEAPDKDTPRISKKKQYAMLKYIGIMFLAAFLFVAITLGIKIIQVNGELDKVSAGARENVAALQSSLGDYEEENRALHSSLDEAAAALDTAVEDLDAAQSDISDLQTQLDTVTAEKDALMRSAEAANLLFLARAAYDAGDSASFQTHMTKLAAYTDALSEAAAAEYTALLDALS